MPLLTKRQYFFAKIKFCGGFDAKITCLSFEKNDVLGKYNILNNRRHSLSQNNEHLISYNKDHSHGKKQTLVDCRQEIGNKHFAL